MKSYCPLTIHCTSLCLDIIHNEKFECLSCEQINDFYDEIYEMIELRTSLDTFNYSCSSVFVEAVTIGIIKVLHLCKKYYQVRDTDWLLNAMESRIRNIP